jgi:hypothetical protein
MVGTKLEIIDNKNPKKQTYAKILNPRDVNDLVLLFWDLKRMFGAPIDKAIQKYLSEQEASPFW